MNAWMEWKERYRSVVGLFDFHAIEEREDFLEQIVDRYSNNCGALPSDPLTTQNALHL